MATLYGVGGSPFVRKVRVVCAEKNIPYDHEPVFPGQVDRKISPLGKVPGWNDERGPLSDSSIICAYLERTRPEPALYPRDPYEYARALWFEEYGDSALLQVFGPKIFFKKIIGPRFMGQQFDPAEIQKAWDAAGMRGEPLCVRMTGCANGCARPYTAEIGIVGQSADLYSLYLGGSPLGVRLAKPFRHEIRTREIAGVLAPLFAAYAADRNAGERFGDWSARQASALEAIEEEVCV